MSGYFAMSRGWQDHALFAGEEYSRRDAWAWLIANAAWKPVRVRTQVGPVILQRGELCFAQRFLAEKWGWSKSRVDRFIHILQAESMIETRPSSGAQAGRTAGRMLGRQAGRGESIITICNYDKFQDARASDRGAERDGKRGAPQTKSGAKKNHITIKPDSPLNPPKGQGRTGLPENWKRPDVTELPPKSQECARQWPASIYEREAEGFALYWRSEGKTKIDWRATWANFIIKQHWKIMQETRRGSGPTGDKPYYQLVNEGRA